jgi:hypothetical protein
MDKQINKVMLNEVQLDRNTLQSPKDDVASNLKPQTSSSETLKPLASISLDLDNLWSYMKTHGDPGWESFPSYLDTFIPLVLDVLDELNLKITFFIVGQDAALEKNHDTLKLITERGHEVGNHSFHHEVWLHSYSKENIKKELHNAEYHIFAATGQKPVGFRGPGFVWSPDLLEVLAENDYLYDASILPTYIGPLARMYYFWKSDLSPEEKAERGKIYSSFREGLRPAKQFYWHMRNRKKLLEIPVTTIPILKTPFHLSYLIYLSRYSQFLMMFYLKTAIRMCLLTGTAPSFLLHPLDFMGGEIIQGLDFFPGMNLETEKKIDIFKTVIGSLSRHFQMVSMSTHAEKLLEKSELKTYSINV